MVQQVPGREFEVLGVVFFSPREVLRAFLLQPIVLLVGCIAAFLCALLTLPVKCRISICLL